MLKLISFLQKSIKLSIWVIFIFFLACGSHESNEKESRLAAIGNKRIITAEDFARRALYARRPEYCKENHFIHKKIIINSLIAEKICAMEEGNDNLLTSSPRFQVYLKSLRQLAMRYHLFHEDFYVHAKIDSIELERSIRVAQRIYETACLTLADQQLADSVGRALYQQHKTFAHVASRIANPDSLSIRKVKWLTEHDSALKDRLYQDSVKVGTLLGPIRQTDTTWIVVKVLDIQQRAQKNEIQQHATESILAEKLRGQNAVQLFAKYKNELLDRNAVSFDSTVLQTVLDTLKNIYADSQRNERRNGNPYWRYKSNCLQFDELVNHFEKQKDEVLFHVNDAPWTLEKFLLELALHPLKLDCQHLDGQLAFHFKNAVIDLLRDKAITDEAYKRGYDQLDWIDHYVLMFKDAYVAELHREFYLQEIGKQADFTSNYTYVTEKYLNPYILDLFQAYANEIIVDNQLLQEIDLNNYYTFAFDNNNPTCLLVPRFPILTTRKWLYYSS